MLYPRMAWKARTWIVALLGVLVVLLCWRFIVKPHEIKRLQRESVEKGRQLRLTFSSQIEHNLQAIQEIFFRVNDETAQEHSIIVNDIDVLFKNNPGLEFMMIPPMGLKKTVVLLNPYIPQTRTLQSKSQCDRRMREHPDLVKHYQQMLVIPMTDSLCVYDTRSHAIAIFNLNTIIKEHLQNEIMKGYFLALLDEATPQFVALDWNFFLAHQEFFHVFGEPWHIKIYPSKAYAEASLKHVFFIFCLTLGGFLGLFITWFIKYRWELIPLNSRYVNHLKRLALYDALTELPNRQHCLEYLNTKLKYSNRGTEYFSVCFLDCNHFKKINDKYGHHVGDLVLKNLASSVSRVIRCNDFFSRFSGDEFCLILDGTSSHEGVRIALDKIFEAISKPIYLEGNQINITLSIGVAVYPESGRSFDVLLRCADEAMYLAKKKKETNAYVIYLT